MTLPSTGVLSLGDANVELGKTRTLTLNINNISVRTLAGKATGVIKLSDLRGKTYVDPTALVRVNGNIFRAIEFTSDSATYYGPPSRSTIDGIEESTIFLDLYHDTTSNLWSLIIVTDMVGVLGGGAIVDFTGLPNTHTIAYSDDTGELVSLTTTTARGTWGWNGANTDGGIIRIPSMTSIYGTTLTFTAYSTANVTQWKFRNTTGFTYLPLTTPLVFAAY